MRIFLSVGLLLASGFLLSAQTRKSISLNADWLSIADEKSQDTYAGFEKNTYTTKGWTKVHVPHNWDQYEGYLRQLHGNKHGFAWYRKIFSTNEKPGKQFFLYFEGVGSYATIWLNGKKVGYHAGGRTTFTLDVTTVIKLNNQPNVLAVRADHPANIQDLPWVDGGCSTERGFSEGSQPMGIFRPVHLVVTNPIRVQPFGMHVWNDDKISTQLASLHLQATVKNYGSKGSQIRVVNRVLNHDKKEVHVLSRDVHVLAGKELELPAQTVTIKNPILWSLENPYLYTIQTQIITNGKIIDEINTPYGIRSIRWPIGETAGQKQFLLNGKPVFIHGIAEYEHLLGDSHAFTDTEIKARVMQIKATGFNAFRDAHQPHNLRYSDYWDQLGILCWTQMAAHIWYDTPEFRANFKQLLTDWVKERRNSPAVVLWGLENESTLPEDFARECTELIRKLDPTASSQRKVTTCNGGKGTDWDVPQNWTGTYGGNPLTYGDDLQKQVLVGEYGAWRTLDLHTSDESGKGYTENKMTDLMETKVRLAESVKDKVAGHFFWLYSSHDNPGRVQGGEGFRGLDAVGPVNYKGMFTPWQEPTDVYYMFKANYASKTEHPMVYIVSHTWPNRWTEPGLKDSVVIYSNCDEVELFNDVEGHSLGKQKRGVIGTHFQWNEPKISYNVLYAVGYVNGKAVARDTILLQNLPSAPNLKKLKTDKPIALSEKGYTYVYRVNCGGPTYRDTEGNTWLADRNLSDKSRFGSSSWTVNYPGVPAFFASQRRTFDPIKGSNDWKLFQTFRYGRNQLKYHFPLPDGEYLVDLYFIEPWLGVGGGINATGMRLFDVAFNNQVVLKNVDIWKEKGTNSLYKKTLKVLVKGGALDVSFPAVAAGQAVISAIAIANLKNVQPATASESLATEVLGFQVQNWLDIGDSFYADEAISFSAIPANLYGAEWLQRAHFYKTKELAFTLTAEADVYLGLNKEILKTVNLTGYEATNTYVITSKKDSLAIYRKRFAKAEKVQIDRNIFFVALLKPSALQPAYDLKTVTSYKATDASLGGQSIVKQELMGKQRVVFTEASGGNITFTMKVGVADTYSLTVKYHNPSSKEQKAQLTFSSLDGTVMKTEEITLAPTKEGKWNYFATTTGSMINAGTYTVKISALDAKGLAVDALDVQ
ncbi:malectin domain-containing carbohydrate-binding protein [Pedobacter sp. MW01-1-1]|uniref:malectin domain-containing carbohydrate-binding protein n=1 Tax=Pedobacter sp. MW01-1-1 TaxID=3383027 RepID=UPI003FEF9DE2